MIVPTCALNPSAIVSVVLLGTIFFLLIDWYVSSAFFGSAPYTFILELIAFAANKVPASKPPPLTGAMIISRSGIFSKSSLAAVPCPAIIFSSL